MPVTDEPLKEKVPFDVYAMMMILAFLSTAGSIAFLNDHLQKHWYAGEQPGMVKHAEKITTLNRLLEDREKWYEYLTNEDVKDISTEIEVTEQDLDDYHRITKLEEFGGVEVEFPPEYKAYPSYIDPIDDPVKTDPGYDNTTDVPEEVKRELIEEYQDTTQAPGMSGAGPAEPEGEGGADAEKRGGGGIDGEGGAPAEE